MPSSAIEAGSGTSCTSRSTWPTRKATLRESSTVQNSLTVLPLASTKPLRLRV